MNARKRRGADPRGLRHSWRFVATPRCLCGFCRGRLFLLRADEGHPQGAGLLARRRRLHHAQPQVVEGRAQRNVGVDDLGRLVGEEVRGGVNAPALACQTGVMGSLSLNAMKLFTFFPATFKVNFGELVSI